MTQKSCLSRIRQGILPVVCLLFTFLGYGPLELFMSNRGSEEFWFSFSELISPLLVIIVVLLVIIMGLLIILPEKGFHITIAIITAVNLLFLIQALFLPNGYGFLNGEAIDWSQYTFRLIYNSLIWIILVGAAVIWATHNWRGFKQFAYSSFILIIVVQAIVLVMLGLTNSKQLEQHKAESEDIYLTTKNEFTLSSNKNTIVIILDAFDSQLMCDLLEEYPDEIQTSFEDFTFYHNTSAGGIRTRYAIPYILTGRTNDSGGSYAEYLKNSYQTSPLFKELRTQKYSTGIYTAYGYVDCSQEDAIDNLSSSEKIQATSQWGLTQSVLKMTAFKYMPHILKPIFWMYSFELTQWQGSKDGNPPYKTDDIQFYHQLQDEGLSVAETKPAFRFIHLNGAHRPFTMDENIQNVPSESNTAKKQGLGSLRIVSEYIQQMKQLGLYDQANIFILADHGDHGYITPNLEQNPLFMAKISEIKAPFSVSDIKLSFLNLSNMIADSLQRQINIEEQYVSDGTRYIYIGSNNNNSYTITEYASDGDAYDTSSYHKTGKIYQPKAQENNDYQLGQLLYLGSRYGSPAQKYFVKGFTHIDPEYVWSNGKEVEMKFKIPNPNENLLLSFDYLTVMNSFQRCYLYANETIIGNFIATKKDKKSFVIPRELITDDLLSIKILLPDCYNPVEHGTGKDNRAMGIGFYSLSIDKTTETFDIEKQITIKKYELGKEITFGNDGNAYHYAISGISQDHWTNKKTVTIYFDDIQTENDLELILSYKTKGTQQHIIISANEVQLADYIASGSEEKTITIPHSILQSGSIILEINLPDAVTPESGDKRELALWMKQMILQEAFN